MQLGCPDQPTDPYCEFLVQPDLLTGKKEMLLTSLTCCPKVLCDFIFFFPNCVKQNRAVAASKALISTLTSVIRACYHVEYPACLEER